MYGFTATFSAILILASCACAQPEVPGPPADLPVVVPLNEERILKVIPDYQTVEDTHRLIAPMTAKQKWNLAWKEVIDPFNNASAVLAAAMSQAGNETPKYGEGGAAYAKRVGAAIGDFGSQNFLSAGVFACLLHQDPRYFRRGPESGVVARALYSVSRIFVTRQDSGRNAFNASNILGMAAGIGASNLYYPGGSRTGAVMLSRVGTSLTGDVMGNLMSEFWPDLQKKFLQKKHK
ncbi:MAG: hypothetical protein P4L56_17105 [Candidatus Sulfopaludibacter sp.]|nr:hypothetical protein [Candidatus Sulfopaludibacter sp.]